VPKRSKPWCNALEALNLTKDATTKPSEWERGVGELYKGVWTFQSAKRGSPNPGMEYLYSPFPLLVVMSKMRTSQMPSRTVRVWIPTVKTWSQLLAEVSVGPADWPPGTRGLSAWDPRAVRGKAADCLPCSPESTPFCLVSRSITDRPPYTRGLSDCPHRSEFSQKTLPKTSDIR
jgi:hypothetical protein